MGWLIIGMAVLASSAGEAGITARRAGFGALQAEGDQGLRFFMGVKLESWEYPKNALRAHSRYIHFPNESVSPVAISLEFSDQLAKGC